MKSIKKFWEKYKFVFLVFIIWRLGLLAIGYWSIGVLRFNASFPYIPEVLIPSGLPQSIWHWANFDGVHYLMIAQFGYNGIVNNEQVFFPLYPILIRFLGNSLMSALLVSNFFALLSGIFICKYFGKWPVLFFYAFPTAFFLGSVYTESLFICLVLLTFYQNKFFGILAGLARFTGGFTSLVAPLGIILYMIYLKISFGNPLLFLFNQGGFGMARASSLAGMITPFQTVFRYLKIIFTADPHNIAYWRSLFELLAFVFAVVILILMLRKMKFWVFIYSWAIILIPSLTGTLLSMPRFVLTVFPIYIFLGSLKTNKVKLVILILFIIMQAILTALFVRGYFIA